MALAKLAALLVLMGGVARADTESNAHIRGELHLLLVGDPGTGEAVAYGVGGPQLHYLRFTHSAAPARLF